MQINGCSTLGGTLREIRCIHSLIPTWILRLLLRPMTGGVNCTDLIKMIHTSIVVCLEGFWTLWVHSIYIFLHYHDSLNLSEWCSLLLLIVLIHFEALFLVTSQSLSLWFPHFRLTRESVDLSLSLVLLFEPWWGCKHEERGFSTELWDGVLCLLLWHVSITFSSLVDLGLLHWEIVWHDPWWVGVLLISHLFHW